MYSDAQIIELSATKLADLIKQNTLTSVQVTKAFLSQIKEVNGKLNAVVEFNEGALQDAQELDDHLANTGEVRGPLHGVPMTIKEQFPVKGMKQTLGGIKIVQDHRAKEDHVVVARLKAAGVVIMGTTNMPDMAMSYETVNNLYGRTNNAVNQNFSAGGSSGGEGAIIAAKGSPLGIGGDIAGSIRIPAHFNGICGLKASFGRVPVSDSIYISETIKFQDLPVHSEMAAVGPLSRFVEDLELVLQIISGPDYVDSYCVLPPYTPPSAKLDLSKLRIAYFFESQTVPVTPCTKRAITAVVHALQQTGAAITETFPPFIERSVDMWADIIGRGGMEPLREVAKMAGGSPTKQLEWIVDFLNPKKLSTSKEYETMLTNWRAYKNQAFAFMRNYDVIISPVMPTPAVPHDGGNILTNLQYTCAWSVAHYPSVVVPTGNTGEGKYEGLPIGVQVVAAPYKEDVAFAVAKFLQQNLRSSPDLVV